MTESQARAAEVHADPLKGAAPPVAVAELSPVAKARQDAQDRLPETMGVLAACRVLGVSVTTWYRRVRLGEWPNWTATTGRNARIARAWVLDTAGTARVLAWLAEDAERAAEAARPGPLGLDGVARLDNHEARIAALEAALAELRSRTERQGDTLLLVTQRALGVKAPRVSPDEPRPK